MWKTTACSLVGLLLCSCSPANRHFDRGIAHGQEGDLNRAIEEFTRAIELDPDLAVAYYNRGGAYVEKGEWDRAIEDCTRAIELKPDLAVAYYNRGAAHSRRGDWDRAIADYTRAAEPGATQAGSANNLAWLLATCPEDSMRDGQKALAYARKACELTRLGDASCLDTLAAAHAELGQYGEAAKWQRKALEDAGYLERSGEAGRARLSLYEAGKPYRDEPKAQPGTQPPAPPSDQLGRSR